MQIQSAKQLCVQETAGCAAAVAEQRAVHMPAPKESLATNLQNWSLYCLVFLKRRQTE